MKPNLDTETIKYIKILYKDNNDFLHCIKASVRHINSVDIYACVKSEEKIFIKTPQKIELDIVGDNGLYKSESILKHVDWQDSYEYLTVKIPEDMEYQQQREYFRVKITERATIIINHEDGIISEIDCATYDLSANGVRLEFDKQYDIPDIITIVVHFSDRDITAQSRYIRTDEEDGIVKASFEFINLNSKDLDFISQICFKKQLEARRKLLY